MPAPLALRAVRPQWLTVLFSCTPLRPQIAGVVAMFRYPADTALAVGINLSQVRRWLAATAAEGATAVLLLLLPPLLPLLLLLLSCPVWPAS